MAGTRIADSTVQAVSGSQKIPVSPDGHITPQLLLEYIQTNGIQIEKTWAQFQSDMSNSLLVPNVQYYITDASNIHPFFGVAYLRAVSIVDFDRENCYAVLGAISGATCKFKINNAMVAVGEIEARFVASQSGSSDPTIDYTQRDDFLGAGNMSYSTTGEYTWDVGNNVLTPETVIACSGHILDGSGTTLVGTWCSRYDNTNKFRLLITDIFGTISDDLLNGTVVEFKLSLQPNA